MAVRRMEMQVQVLLMLAILASLLLLFLVPAGSVAAGVLWFWLVILFAFSVLWLLLRQRTSVPVRVPEVRMLYPEEQPEVIQHLMDTRVAVEDAGVKIFRGRLRADPDVAFQELKRNLPSDIVPMLQEDPQLGAAVLLVPRPVEQATMEQPVVRYWVHWLLFGLTVITTTWAGAAHQGVDLLRQPEHFVVGLPYAIGLLSILGVHELGHYFTAKSHGIHVTPPYFIPVPFALGTFGAFIRMRTPTETRRALFDVAVAGPLAGLVIAIPALLVGLQTSSMLEDSVDARAAGPIPIFGGISVGSSILFAVLARLARPDALQLGCVLQLSPLAFAGWLGLLVTALNLVPVGQLDGGHMARAMFGSRTGSSIGSIAMWSLLLLAIFFWPGLLLWAIIVFFIAGSYTPPLNDLSGLDSWRMFIGFATFLILLLILVPLPRGLWALIGLECPPV